MKLTLVVFSIFFFIASNVCFSQSKSDVFNAKTSVTWLGLDFTGAKFIGDRERLGAAADIHHLITSWNDIIIKETDKYDVALAIDKLRLENAIHVTRDHNETLDVLSMTSDLQKDYIHLKASDVAEIISSYDFKGIEGIGLMFNIETFSKPDKEGSLWATFINMSSKEVLFTERLTGEPGGAGLRNYWANAVYNVIKKIQKKEFEMWRKKYYRP